MGVKQFVGGCDGNDYIGTSCNRLFRMETNCFRSNYMEVNLN